MTDGNGPSGHAGPERLRRGDLQLPAFDDPFRGHPVDDDPFGDRPPVAGRPDPHLLRLVDLADEFHLTTAQALDVCAQARVPATDGATVIGPDLAEQFRAAAREPVEAPGTTSVAAGWAVPARGRPAAGSPAAADPIPPDPPPAPPPNGAASPPPTGRRGSRWRRR
jgi:hypothetical protein